MSYKRPATEKARQQAREASDAKLAALQERLTEQVAAITTGDDWTRWLDFGAKFHSYSFKNVMLILMQDPDASQVAGFRRWQELGRQVRKGEHGIAIYAPVTRKVEVENTTTHETETRTRMVNVRIAYVFDVAQTEGDPLPEGPHPELVAGAAPQGLLEELNSQIRAAGFTVQTGPIETPAGANGVTNYTDHTVTVRDDLDEAQQVKTAIHELAHVLLHDPAQVGQGCRGQIEVEAESVAYLVASHQGMDVGGYSFPYVASWVSRTEDADAAKVLEQTGRNVMATAKKILAPLTTVEASEKPHPTRPAPRPAARPAGTRRP